MAPLHFLKLIKLGEKNKPEKLTALRTGEGQEVTISLFLSFSLFLFFFLGLHSWQMDVPRLGVELELQLPAYTTATVKQDPSHICDLHHNSWKHRSLTH